MLRRWLLLVEKVEDALEAAHERFAVLWRWLLLGAGLLAVLWLAGSMLADWVTRPSPGVTEENFWRLRDQMTEEQVGALLGEPGKDFWRDPEEWEYIKAWGADSVSIHVAFKDAPKWFIGREKVRGRMRYALLCRNGDWRNAEHWHPGGGRTSFLDCLRRLLPW